MNLPFVAFLFVLIVQGIFSAYCSGKPKADAHVNNIPFDTKQPVYVRSTQNGHYYTAGSKEEGTFMHVMHLYGTPYEMGRAHCDLLGKELLNGFIGQIWDAIDGEIEKEIPWFPEWFKKLIAQYGINMALDVTYEMTVKYTSPHFYEEIHGMADACGLDWKIIRRIHLLGELTKGSCSMMGAYGSATINGTTIQLRAFDWNVEPFAQQPAVIVYHPNEGNGHAFANLGFIGWVGSFSGISSKQMAISEIGIYFSDETFGTESRFGNPFTFLLRDILQFDNTIDDAINRMINTHRTCDLVLAVGDGKLGTVKYQQYSASVLNVFDDINAQPHNETWHPRIKDVVYLGMDWLCPPFSQRLSERIQKFHGKITPEVTAREIVSMTTTGNIQVAIYDLTANHLYISYASPDGKIMAYNNKYRVLEMNPIFAVPPPKQQNGIWTL